MIFDKIELLDHDYGTVKKSSKIRKIKFKSISFKNISNLWKNFRISCLEKRLANKKDKLVSMEIDNQDFNEKTFKGDMSVAENKILRKTSAIARLESKINFLRTGTKSTDDFISSRAIKLKDNMMKNMRFNSNSAYSILPENAEKIFDTEEQKVVDPVKEIMDETKKKVAEDVQRIMQEQTAPVEQVVEQQEPVTVTAPSREEIRKTVNELFAVQDAERRNANQEVVEEQNEEITNSVEENVNIVEETAPVTEEVVTTENFEQPVEETVVVEEEVNQGFNEIDVTPEIPVEDVQEVVAEGLNQIDVTPVITESEVEETIKDELDNIKVSQNESSAAKVNKFINEDGTYRMKREDIDEDFRITKIDREPVEEKPLTMVDMMKKALREAGIPVEDIKVVDEPKQNPQIEEQKKVEREVPIVAPEREDLSIKQKVKDLSAAVDEVETMDDIKQIMASVAELRNLQEQQRTKAAEVEEDTIALRAERAQAVQELLNVQAELQADYENSRQVVQAKEAENAALADEIVSIREAIGAKGR